MSVIQWSSHLRNRVGIVLAVSLGRRVARFCVEAGWCIHWRKVYLVWFPELHLIISSWSSDNEICTYQHRSWQTPRGMLVIFNFRNILITLQRDVALVQDHKIKWEEQHSVEPIKTSSSSPATWTVIVKEPENPSSWPRARRGVSVQYLWIVNGLLNLSCKYAHIEWILLRSFPVTHCSCSSWISICRNRLHQCRVPRMISCWIRFCITEVWFDQRLFFWAQFCEGCRWKISEHTSC